MMFVTLVVAFSVIAMLVIGALWPTLAPGTLGALSVAVGASAATLIWWLLCRRKDEGVL